MRAREVLAEELDKGCLRYMVDEVKRGEGYGSPDSFVIRAMLAFSDEGSGIGIPEGYALVPIEPTREMIDAGEKVAYDGNPYSGHDAGAIWRAMVAACRPSGSGAHPMTTPVDIDKLKELLAKCDPESANPCEQCGGYGEWFAHSPDCHNDSCALACGIDDCNGQVEPCYCQDKLLAAAQISLPALIAKAERVDAMTEALRPFAQVAEGEVYKLFAQEARLTFTLCRPDGKRFCFINAECFDAARNALSPKESE